MKRKILAIFLCIFSIVLFCGCASATYIIKFDASGAVTQAFSFSFSKKAIENAGKDVSDFKQNIIYLANSIVGNAHSDFQNSHDDDEIVKTWNNKECKFSEIVDLVYNNLDISNTIQSIMLGVNGYKFSWDTASDGDTITCTISLKFLNYYAYCYFYDIYPDTEDEETEIQDRVFYVKSVSESQTVFFDLQNSDVAEYLLTYFDNKFTLNDVKYSFCCVTQNSKMHSDADYVEKTSNGYVHVWNYSMSDISEGKGMVHTYTVKIRAYPWYIAAVGASLLVAATIWIVSVAKNKRDKKILKLSATAVDNSDNKIDL